MIKNDRTNQKRRNDDGRLINATQAHPDDQRSTNRTGPFTVLFVCSANLCRSVAAQTLMGRALGDSATTTWRLESAGLNVDPAYRVPQACEPVMKSHQIPVDRTAQPLSAAMVESADLIVTADRNQRSQIVKALPSAKRRVFTLRQLARFAAAGRCTDSIDTIDDGDTLMEAVASGRVSLQPVDPADDDIVDPATRPSKVGMEACIDMIQACLDDIVG